MRITDTTLRDQEVRLDFSRFERCRFERCRLVYGGHGPTGFEECTFVETTWHLVEAAANTLHFLTALRKSGDPVCERLVETTIEHVRSGVGPRPTLN
jgi:hypothetical protein